MFSYTWGGRWTLALASGLGMLVLPFSTVAPAGPAAKEKRSLTSEFHGHRNSWEVRWHDGERHLRLRAKGQIDLSEDWSEVISISPRGYLDIEADEGDGERRVRLEGERDGRISRRWWVEGDKRPFDDEAAAWLVSMLPEVARRTGFQASGRVRGLLKAAGVDGVLAEIDELEADHIKRRYYTELLGQARLSGSDLGRVLEHAGRSISSDFELAQLLVDCSEAGELDAAAAAGYARASGGIASDFDKARALRALAGSAGPDAIGPLLAAAESIDSDHELAELLVEVARRRDLDDGVRDRFFTAASTLGGDFDQRRALQALIDRSDLGSSWLVGILEVAQRGLDSDHEQAELLVGVAQEYKLSGDARQAYLEACDTIGASHDNQRVLAALVGGERRPRSR